MNPIFINYVIQTVKMFILLIIIIIFLRLYMYPLDIICRPEKQSITKIISCNIHGLPFSNDEYYAQRLHSFLLHCRSNCECIVLQEVWYRQVMEIVESALQGWSIVYSPRRFPASTGLLIATNCNISKVRSHFFKYKTGPDSFVHKGVLTAKIGNLTVANTHLQDPKWGSAVHSTQMKEIKQLLKSQKLPQNTIILGDWNCTPHDMLKSKYKCVSAGLPTCDEKEMDWGLTSMEGWTCEPLPYRIADHVPIMITSTTSNEVS